MSEPTDTSKRGFQLKSIATVFRIFGPHLLAYWKTFAIAYVALGCTVLMKLVTPWPLKYIFDHVLLDVAPPPQLVAVANFLGFGDGQGIEKMSLLTSLCIAMVVLVVLSGVFAYTKRYLMSSASERMTNDVRKRVFQHLQMLSQAYHGTSRSGDLIVRMTSDIKALRSLMIKSVANVVSLVLTFGTVIATMLWMDWQLTLIALVIVPPLYLVSLRVSGSVGELSRTQRTKESEIASLVQENMSSMAVIQAFAEEKQESDRFARVSQENLTAELKKLKISRGFSRAVDILVAVGTAVVVWYAAQRVLDGYVTPGDIIVFVAYLKNLYKPVTGVSALFIEFYEALVRAERIAEILKTDVTIADAPDAIEAPDLQGRIQFENVTFGYEENEPVLRNLSFSVEPGQMVALVGSSGNGKSTVVKALLRFFDPWEGRVLVDGHDIRDLKLKSMRRQISIVPQEAMLFRRTIRENIAYGRPDASIEDVIAAAEAAQAHSFIEGLPNGYDTVLDEGGRNLSGGQGQRITLARAILRDAPVLVMDEPVTGLDAVTEAQVHKSIAHLTKGKTSFVIAHRLSTVMKANLILVIEEGKIIEQGTHAELLERSSIYRHVFEIQHGAAESPVPVGE